MKKEISLRHKVEMTDGIITSEWLLLNDESVPVNGIPMRISVHPHDVPELIEKLKKWTISQPNNPKEDWSQCNDCFDGLHDKCIGVEYGCECKHKITQPNNPTY